ncbi:MAG: UDP-N-acetylglucosamine--N-acetylmuramyl-(pentapeptide) pyrophosphoryl-undecaprenol N-acetylglucosamine transferase [Candidatus Acetothermia bacterium]
MRILVTGGGTGGHFYPALSVMKALKASTNEHQICYVGTGEGLEAEVAPDYEWLDFRIITLTGLSRSSILGFLKGIAFLPVGLIQTLLVVISFKPDAIYGTGGYTTFPPAFWGILLGVPVITHELNLKPGITNRVVSRFVNKVLLSFPETENLLSGKNSKVTGTPVREEIRNPSEDLGPNDFGLRPDSPIILVFGGSHGSRILANKVFRSFEEARGKASRSFQFLVQTGKNRYSEFENRLKRLETEKIRITDYIKNMGDVYSLSDLVVSRGGAGTMAELIEARKPAIIVPWKGAAENHQFHNARYLEEIGGALLVEEEEWKGLSLLETLEDIFTTDGRLEEMSRSYAEITKWSGAGGVVDTINEIVGEVEPC